MGWREHTPAPPAGASAPVERQRGNGYVAGMLWFQLVRRAVMLAACLPLFAAGCADSAQPGGTEAAGAAASVPRYTREFTFVGARDARPLLLRMVFHTRDHGDRLAREVNGSIAHGGTWEPFLTEQWQSSGSAAVWRVLPRGALRLAAGVEGRVSALWYRERERAFRMEPLRPLSSWNGGRYTRYRVLAGRLRLGGESTEGVLLESMRAERTGRDVPPRPDENWLFLTDGESLHLVVRGRSGSDAESEAVLATGSGEGEEVWKGLEVRTGAARSLQKARRDVPLEWSFAAPVGGLHGQVRALGFTAELGAERAGRRAVDVSYTVTGWAEVGGRRVRVMGFARHGAG